MSPKGGELRTIAATVPQFHVVPPRALAISAAALAVSVAGAMVFPQGFSEYGFLAWLLPMIPAFLLCYYRGWTRLMIMLAAAMALLALGYGVAALLGTTPPEWPSIGFVIAAYIGIALGAGWFREVRTAQDQRAVAEHALHQTSLHLRQSHTDLQVAQWRLIEAERLEAVGQLAAGVAHEVKNPLMTLLTGVHYLMQRAPATDGDMKTLLADMHDAIKRADAVIMGLLDFSQPRELALAPADLNAVVQRSAVLVKHEMTTARLTLALDLSADLPPLPLDVFKLQQVLVNVLTNAAHATPPGGRVTARTYRRDDVTVLEVDDTGSGIPEEALGKLFDPFFTTKPTGKGTGLGLAVSRQIVEMHGASIDIGNRPDGGARVTIAFNAVKERA
ncbi:MAG: ATP-binding protein [Gemmatimonadales bacterium]|nr:ATP-binding protein [Gemmatimonadales bacterium]